MSRSLNRSVLISGASIAGPTLAYWLSRAGWDVTVVEVAPAVRAGGYPVDVRGVAVEVARRMGLLSRLRELQVDTQRIAFVDGRGRTARSLDTAAFIGQQVHQDVEVPRGGLTKLLYEQTRGDVEYVFGDSIEAMQGGAAAVDVTFRSGAQRSFGVVVGSDGIHSAARRLAFGAESQFDRYLGWCFAVFTAPNRMQRANEVVVYNTPGRMAAVYAVGDQPTVHAIVAFRGPRPTDDELRDVDSMRRLAQAAFAGAGWEIPDLLADLESAEDPFCDSISQIRMPTWSAGRVVVVGDAAFAPSFLSGQGTSAAMAGGYLLASELSTVADHTAAFAGYERRLRPFISRNQALANGGGALTIDSRNKLFARNQMLRLLPLLARLGVTSKLGANIRRASTALTLPEFAISSQGSSSTGAGDPSSEGEALDADA